MSCLLSAWPLRSRLSLFRRTETPRVEFTREVKFADGSARLKAYDCSLSETGEPVLQVEFDRLSEAAAGSLVEGSQI